MSMTDDVVARVMSQAGIPSRSRRSAVERELRNHIEDVAAELRASGCSDHDLAARIRERFGDPGEVATAFSETYRSSRFASHALFRSMQLVGSFGAVGVLIAGVQLVAAFVAGVEPVSILARMRMEVFGFLALTTGYVGSTIADRTTGGRSVSMRIAVSVGFVAAAMISLTVVAPGHVLAPAVACFCAAAVRFLERARIRFAPLLGTAGPMLSAWALVGPVVVRNGHLSPTVAPIIVTLDVAVACQLMSWLSSRVDRHLATG